MNFITYLPKTKLVTYSLNNKKLPFYLHTFKRFIKKRVVVTGLGVVCPVGTDVSTSWKNILNGVSGITKLGPEYDKFSCRIGGLVDETKISNFEIVNNLTIASKATKYVLVAIAEALSDAQIDLEDVVELDITGACIGCAHTNLSNSAEIYGNFLETGYENFDLYNIPRGIIYTPAVVVSNKYKLRGPVLCQTCGNSTGIVSIGEGYRFIKHHPNVEIMICGATEACISPFYLSGLSKRNFLSSKYNDTPEKASRPFDKDRDGAVIGEGAGVLILESLEHALNRQASIYCEILGYGVSVHDMTSLDGNLIKTKTISIIRSMALALLDAKVHAEAVSYINACGSSSIVTDYSEALAIQELFGDRSWELYVSSTKGAHGHLMASSGNVETVFACMAIFDGKLPPTLNNNMNESEFHLNFVPEFNSDYYSKRKIVLKNSISISGVNASLCLTQFNPSKLIK